MSFSISDIFTDFYRQSYIEAEKEISTKELRVQEGGAGVHYLIWDEVDYVKQTKPFMTYVESEIKATRRKIIKGLMLEKIRTLSKEERVRIMLKLRGRTGVSGEIIEIPFPSYRATQDFLSKYRVQYTIYNIPIEIIFRFEKKYGSDFDKYFRNHPLFSGIYTGDKRGTVAKIKEAAESGDSELANEIKSLKNDIIDAESISKESAEQAKTKYNNHFFVGDVNRGIVKNLIDFINKQGSINNYVQQLKKEVETGKGNLFRKAGSLAKALYLLEINMGNNNPEVPPAIDYKFLTGGHDLGHIFSVRAVQIQNSLMNTFITRSKGTLKPEDAQRFEGLLAVAVAKVFDDPSIDIKNTLDSNGKLKRAVILENKNINRAKGAQIKQLAAQTASNPRENNALQKVLTIFFDEIENSTFEHMDKNYAKVFKDIAAATSSPTYYFMLEKIIEETWDKGKSAFNPSKFDSNKIIRTNLKAKANKVKVTKSVRRQAKKDNPKVPRTPTPVKQLGISQNTKQSFLNLTKIKLYVNSHLHDTMQEKMKGQRLHYRTGRLARSAQVVNIQQTRKNTIALYYTYMKNPYATFAKGGKQHTPRRDVDNLIMASARSVAREVVANKFKLSIRGT